jgi:hypothetical protein
MVFSPVVKALDLKEWKTKQFQVIQSS